MIKFFNIRLGLNCLYKISSDGLSLLRAGVGLASTDLHGECTVLVDSSQDGLYDFSLYLNGSFVGAVRVAVGLCYVRGVGCYVGGNDCAYIYQLHMDPMFRGRGLGSYLLRYLLSYEYKECISSFDIVISGFNKAMGKILPKFKFDLIRVFYTLGVGGRRFVLRHEGGYSAVALYTISSQRAQGLII